MNQLSFQAQQLYLQLAPSQAMSPAILTAAIAFLETLARDLEPRYTILEANGRWLPLTLRDGQQWLVAFRTPDAATVVADHLGTAILETPTIETLPLLWRGLGEKNGLAFIHEHDAGERLRRGDTIQPRLFSRTDLKRGLQQSLRLSRLA